MTSSRRGSCHHRGEERAGKSTLIKILSGIEQPTSGSIHLRWPECCAAARRQGRSHGHRAHSPGTELAEHLTVADSIFLGRELRQGPFLKVGEMRRRAAEVMETLHVRVDPDARISSLSVADKQMVEIAKAISRDARVLIMDEPTAVLSVGETQTLFEQIRRLTARGVSWCSFPTSSMRSWSLRTASPCCAMAN
jgi:ribose transport system ATP-binding protein